jgi:hypothetical protein
MPADPDWPSRNDHGLRRECRLTRHGASPPGGAMTQCPRDWFTKRYTPGGPKWIGLFPSSTDRGVTPARDRFLIDRGCMSTHSKADREFDAVILGCGSAGTTAAKRLRADGHTVAVIEMDQPGVTAPCARGHQGAASLRRDLLVHWGRHWLSRSPRASSSSSPTQGAGRFSAGISPRRRQDRHTEATWGRLVRYATL